MIWFISVLNYRKNLLLAYSILLLFWCMIMIDSSKLSKIVLNLVFSQIVSIISFVTAVIFLLSIRKSTLNIIEFER